LRSIYVPLPEETLQRLGRLARQDLRHPKDEALLLLQKALDDVEAEASAPTLLTHFARRDDDAS
jgi:hypothetical protein